MGLETAVRPRPYDRGYDSELEEEIIVIIVNVTKKKGCREATFFDINLAHSHPRYGFLYLASYVKGNNAILGPPCLLTTQ